jgi:hypothetical protein
VAALFTPPLTHARKVVVTVARRCRISSRDLLFMSYESRTMIDRVSIHLFRTGNLLCSSVCERLGQAHGCLLIAKGLVADGLGDLHDGRQIGGMPRTTTRILDRFREGVICYLFIRFSDLFLVGDLRNLEVIIDDDSLVCQMPMIQASTVGFFLNHSQFLRLRGTLSQLWRPIFNTVQPPSFQVLSKYCRQRFTLMDQIHESARRYFPSPICGIQALRSPTICDQSFKMTRASISVQFESVRASCPAVTVIENRLLYIYHRQCHWTYERKSTASIK